MAKPKLQYAIGNSASTTLSTGITNTDTTAPLTADTNFQAAPVAGEGMILLDEGTANEELAYSTGVSGGALAIPLANRGLEGGSAQGHDAQSSVKGVLTSDMWNDLVEAMTNVLVQSTGAVDATKVITPTGADFNGNEIILDADADTTVTADTDDQIDWKLGGSDRFRMKNSGDYDIVGSTGNIQVAGADPKRGFYIPAAGWFSATTNGAATGQIETSTNKVNAKVLDFDQSTEEYACFNMPAPDFWDLGTVTFQFHWTAASGTGDVIWGAQGLARSNDDALDTAYGTAQEVTDTLIATNDEHVTSATSAITIAGTPAKGDQLYFRIYRKAANGSDTLNADARLIGVRIKFSIGQYDDQ